MPQPSPVRSPAVNRRFMEPIDGYIYQVRMLNLCKSYLFRLTPHDILLLQVQFKRAHKNFILAPSAPRNIIPRG